MKELQEEEGELDPRDLVLDSRERNSPDQIVEHCNRNGTESF